MPLFGTPAVRRGPLHDERYVLDNFHFHWGRNDGEGSEHTINGTPCVLEVRPSHTQASFYSTVVLVVVVISLIAIKLSCLMSDVNKNVHILERGVVLVTDIITTLCWSCKNRLRMVLILNMYVRGWRGEDLSKIRNLFSSSTQLTFQHCVGRDNYAKKKKISCIPPFPENEVPFLI
jgi:hypothetical protein